MLEIYGVSLLWLLEMGLDDISNTCVVIFAVSLSTPLCKQWDAVGSQARAGVLDVAGRLSTDPHPQQLAWLVLCSSWSLLCESPVELGSGHCLRDREKVKTATVWRIWDRTRVKKRWKVSDPRLCSLHLSQTLFDLFTSLFLSLTNLSWQLLSATIIINNVTIR